MRRTLSLLIAFLALSNCGPQVEVQVLSCDLPDITPNRAAAVQIVELDRPFAEALATHQDFRKSNC